MGHGYVFVFARGLADFSKAPVSGGSGTLPKAQPCHLLQRSTPELPPDSVKQEQPPKQAAEQTVPPARLPAEAPVLQQQQMPANKAQGAVLEETATQQQVANAPSPQQLEWPQLPKCFRRMALHSRMRNKWRSRRTPSEQSRRKPLPQTSHLSNGQDTARSSSKRITSSVQQPKRRRR
eukprot:5233891-Amphidinium_carterae.1